MAKANDESLIQHIMDSTQKMGHPSLLRLSEFISQMRGTDRQSLSAVDKGGGVVCVRNSH